MFRIRPVNVSASSPVTSRPSLRSPMRPCRPGDREARTEADTGKPEPADRLARGPR